MLTVVGSGFLERLVAQLNLWAELMARCHAVFYLSLCDQRLLHLYFDPFDILSHQKIIQT
jgi:hypothetical protein